MSKQLQASKRTREEERLNSRDRVINLLLKGIIAANPHHDSSKTPELRLSQAREALLGEKPRRGRKVYTDDVELFPFIREQLKHKSDALMRAVLSRYQPEVRIQIEAELSRPKKSARRSARDLGERIGRRNVQLSSTIDRVRAVDPTKLTSFEVADLEGLYHNDSGKARALQRAFDGLSELGIQSRNPLVRDPVD